LEFRFILNKAIAKLAQLKVCSNSYTSQHDLPLINQKITDV